MTTGAWDSLGLPEIALQNPPIVRIDLRISLDLRPHIAWRNRQGPYRPQCGFLADDAGGPQWRPSPRLRRKRLIRLEQRLRRQPDRLVARSGPEMVSGRWGQIRPTTHGGEGLEAGGRHAHLACCRAGRPGAARFRVSIIPAHGRRFRGSGRAGGGAGRGGRWG